MRKALRFSVCALFLALALAVTQIPAKQVEADTKPTQSETSDFQMDGNILVKYTGTAQTVSVPASVTSIAAEAFAGNKDMETIVFSGNKLQSIGYRAFADCTNLKEVKIPDTVEELQNGAFSNCAGLKKVTLGTALRKLGIGVFAGCDALQKMELAADNTAFKVDDDCLYSKDGTKLYMMFPYREKETYTMPSGVTDIAEYAFWNCNHVKGISLSSHLEEIPDYAFSNCKSLTGITIPYSVKSIGIKSFSDCVNLEAVNIPTTVSSIHNSAFDGCPKLKIVAEEGSAAYKFYQEWLSKNQAEYEDTGVTEDTSEEVTPEDTMPEVTSKPQEEDDDGIEMGSTIVVANSAVVFIDNSEDYVYEEIVSSGDNQGGVDTELVKSWEIPKYKVFDKSGSRILADQAFYKEDMSDGYEIPENVTEIGEFTFARSKLDEIRIPEGVTTIGYGAFYHCDYLRTVSIPSTVTSIAPKAFEETFWLESWKNGVGTEDYLVVGDGILLAYRGNGGYLEIPDTVKRIAPEVFAGNRTIYSVEIPDSVIEIGEDAFNGCLNLKTVTGGKYVQYLKDRAFYGCELQSAHVGSNVAYIGRGVFDFSKTSMSASSKVVVFDGTTLPTLSHELTAERLSNQEARNYALGDTLFVIVDKKVKTEDLQNTVLDINGYGFKGIIAYVSTMEPKTVACIATTCTKEELAGIYIPEYIMIDGYSYKVEGRENIGVYGNKTEYEPGTLLVTNNSQLLKQAVVSAELEGNTEAVEIMLQDGNQAVLDMMNEAYRAVYRDDVPDSSKCFEISMTDLNTNVPITRTGNQTLRVTIALPDKLSMLANNNLRVLTLDRNGQIVNLSYFREGNTITYAANTTGPILLSCAGKVPSGQMDASPDTGIRDIPPKYFLSAALFSLAIASLFIKKKHHK